MGGTSCSFGPEELILLRSVLDEATAALPIVQQTSAVKAILAQKIIACANKGERDPVRIRTAVLTQFRTENLRFVAPSSNVVPWK